MIRAALGGVVALAGLIGLWLWLLADAVPEAFAPPRATVRTLDLDVGRLVPQAAALARSVEERLEAVAPVEASAPEVAEASVPEGEDLEVALAPEPALDGPDGLVERVDPAVDAALIRRMLDVYARTRDPE